MRWISSPSPFGFCYWNGKMTKKEGKCTRENCFNENFVALCSSLEKRFNSVSPFRYVLILLLLCCSLNSSRFGIILAQKMGIPIGRSDKIPMGWIKMEKMNKNYYICLPIKCWCVFFRWLSKPFRSPRIRAENLSARACRNATSLAVI